MLCGRHSSCSHSPHTHGYVISRFTGWGQPTCCGVAVGGASRLGHSAPPVGWLRLSPLHCNNALLPQTCREAGIALAGTVHTHIGIPYQGLVAGGNLLAEWYHVGGRSAELFGRTHLTEVLFSSHPRRAEAVTLDTTIQIHIHISYQVVVAGGHLLAKFQAAVTVRVPWQQYSEAAE